MNIRIKNLNFSLNDGFDADQLGNILSNIEQNDGIKTILKVTVSDKHSDFENIVNIFRNIGIHSSDTCIIFVGEDLPITNIEVLEVT